MDVVVLEAQPKIGGRLHTYNYNGTALDLGASWIHGLNINSSEGPINPIYKLATTNNIKFKKTDSTSKVYDSVGNIVDGGSLDAYFYKYEQIIQKKLDNSKPNTWTTISVEDVMKEVGAFAGNKTEEHAKLRYVIESEINMDTATGSSGTSFESTQTDAYFYGDDDEVIFPEGYNQIANCLAGGLDIRQATVTKVDYSKQPVVLATNKGNFTAKYVVSTLPLGVLKNNDVEFLPQLNIKKRVAIQNLTMGTMDKVFLIYNDTEAPFWSLNETWIGRIPYDGKEDGVHNLPWKFFFNLHKYNGRPILLAFNTDDSAIKLEKESDDAIKGNVTQELRKMYKNNNIAEPEIVRTKWAMNEASWGSYSSIPVGGSSAYFGELSSPIGNKLFFAGEATIAEYYGTVHGAYISGYRAAQEILKLENKVDTEHEQLEHGIGRTDIICPKGSEISYGESDEINCLLIRNDKYAQAG